MNRAPSKNDTWWAEHSRTCGGQFKKIKEPEDYGKKGNKRKISEKNTNNSKVDPERNSSDTAVNKSPSLSKWFKPIKELDASNPDNIRERKNDNLDSLKKPLSMFSGNGRRLDSGQSVRSVSKEQWIENLMKKQVGVSGKRQMASGFISAAGPQQKPLKAIVDGAANQKTRVNVVSSSTVSKPGSTHKDNNITGFKQNFTQEVSVMKSRAVNKKCHALPGQNSAPSSSSSFCNTSQSNNQFNGLRETIPRQTVKESANSTIEKFPSLTVEDACMPVDSRPVTLENIPKTVQSIKTSGPSIGDSESGPKLFWNRKDVKQQDIQTIPIVINDSPPCNQRSTKFVECPACPKLIPENMINAHLDKCLAQAFS
ncbi:DNA-dependent metalloprotease SPRTN-like [Rhopilema esculentum]|uniref:DNA-dependent metalloprotease SPRTN-like n=1 Tax=Rhopilema esculentum TaxID=499914 RepID=UPI0031D84E19